jgi:hypothetical protein
LPTPRVANNPLHIDFLYQDSKVDYTREGGVLSMGLILILLSEKTERGRKMLGLFGCTMAVGSKVLERGVNGIQN